jgi:hypothetical protein
VRVNERAGLAAAKVRRSGVRLVCYMCESHGRRQTKEPTNERTKGKACGGLGPRRREHSIRMEEGGEDNESPPPRAIKTRGSPRREPSTE